MNVSLKYKKTDTLAYYPFPFEVPKDTERIEIIVRNDSKINGIDISLESPEGFQGWSGGTLSQIIIASDFASEGYFPGIQEGQWQLLIGLAKLYEDNSIEAEIICHQPDTRWLAGDLHMHSIHSDGIYTVPEVMNHVKEAGLDFMALTDHNAMSGHHELSHNIGLIHIPGVELTSYYGHANVWNIEEPLKNVIFNNDDELTRIIKSLPATAMLSINHPFFKDTWKLSLNHPFTHIEVWNAFWDQGNYDCIQWWHDVLCEGRKLIAVGGSDAHGKHPDKWFGYPTTRVKSDSLTKEGILEGLREGKVCICYSPKSPYLEFIKNSEKVSILIHQFSPCKLRLFTDKGLLSEEILMESSVHDYTFEGYRFIRGELWQLEENIPFAISNPLWF
ncbi:CehA/McbA family metallohydrolase [Vallitalea okinawensis]|uniref:CehA/McbA family metallohydrolase n=1 Tax=Vallitalea okinawensis TaxID=2078660 RepID=UPI000CFD1ECB|nr:CehA/McbA family metallohydrolase [Vallitalea okinawensis]